MKFIGSKRKGEINLLTIALIFFILVFIFVIGEFIRYTIIFYKIHNELEHASLSSCIIQYDESFHSLREGYASNYKLIVGIAWLKNTDHRRMATETAKALKANYHNKKIIKTIIRSGKEKKIFEIKNISYEIKPSDFRNKMGEFTVTGEGVVTLYSPFAFFKNLNIEKKIKTKSKFIPVY